MSQQYPASRAKYSADLEILSLFPGTLATYQLKQGEEEPMTAWYWILLFAIFAVLFSIALT